MDNQLLKEIKQTKNQIDKSYQILDIEKKKYAEDIKNELGQEIKEELVKQTIPQSIKKPGFWYKLIKLLR